jgi:hypothetical protein
MQSPEIENKFLAKLNDIDKIAYFTLFEKYIVQNLRGHAKLIEIESTDQESIIKSLNGGFPIPGMVYTFLYDGPNVLVKSKDKTKIYQDFIPLVFCMNVQKDFFTGINFNTLPSDIRLQFLIGYYDTFKDYLSEVERDTQNRILSINTRFITYIKSGKGQEMLKIFNSKYGANFNFGFRKYLVQKVERLRMVEYQEWNYIPFYQPKDAFRLMNQAQIHQLYYQSKNNENL